MIRITSRPVTLSAILMLLLLLPIVVKALADEHPSPNPEPTKEPTPAIADKADVVADAQKSKPLSIESIIENTNRVAYYQGKDGRARVSMTITNAQGRTRRVSFTILRYDEPPPEKADDGSDITISDELKKKFEADLYYGDQRFYVYFHLPADVNKMVFMVRKHLKKDDDRWLYLPALDLVKRIAATDKRSSFVGSDFFYEDVSGRNIDADVHELIKTTENYYVLKNTPHKPKEVEFAYYIMWIHRKTFIPVKIEYYDAKNKIHRLYEALKVETIQDYPTVTQASMKNLDANTQTVTTYSDVKYNIDVPADVFTERYLRRPPQEYLR